MKRTCACLFSEVVIAFYFVLSTVGCALPLQTLDNYNVVWDNPSKDMHGSMPLGNGDIGANVWMEENGDLVFYISKTDSWGDNGRLLKVGRVRMTFSPNILENRTVFRQELDLKNGQLLIYSEGDNSAVVKFWIDANHPVIHVTTTSQKPLEETAKVELWRTRQMPRKNQISSPLYNNPAGRQLIVEPDTVVKDYSDGVSSKPLKRRTDMHKVTIKTLWK